MNPLPYLKSFAWLSLVALACSIFSDFWLPMFHRSGGGDTAVPICPGALKPSHQQPQIQSQIMAIKLIANYSKRLGLPGYSSHQFSVSVETELVSTNDLEAESERIYHLLQSNVDAQILETGFVPHSTYGMDESESSPGTKSENNSDSTPNNITQWPNGAAWKCSDKQRDLILKIVDENNLDKKDTEALARERFGKGVRQLNKMEASGLIDELLDRHGGKQKGGGGNSRNRSAYSGGNRRRAA